MTEALVRIWVAWMLPVAWQAALLGLVAMTVERLAGRWRGPRLTAVLWLLVLARLVTPPWLRWDPVPMGSLLASLPPAIQGLPPEARQPGGTAALLACLWLAGALVSLLVLMGAAWRHKARLLAGSRPAPAHLRREAALRAREMGLRACPTLALVPRLSSPCVTGLLRPWVLLPLSVLEGPEAERRHMLLHELGHLRRRDPLRAFLGALVAAAYWFHPMAWILVRRLAHQRELACDRMVVRRLEDGVDPYCRTLLRWGLQRGISPSGPALLDPRSRLLERLQVLRRPNPGPSWTRSLLAGGVFLAAALVLLPTGVLGLPSFMGPPSPVVAPPSGCLQLRYQILGRLAREAGSDRTAAVPEESFLPRKEIP